MSTLLALCPCSLAPGLRRLARPRIPSPQRNCYLFRDSCWASPPPPPQSAFFPRLSILRCSCSCTSISGVDDEGVRFRARDAANRRRPSVPRRVDPRRAASGSASSFRSDEGGDDKDDNGRPYSSLTPCPETASTRTWHKQRAGGGERREASARGGGRVVLENTSRGRGVIVGADAATATSEVSPLVRFEGVILGFPPRNDDDSGGDDLGLDHDVEFLERHWAVDRDACMSDRRYSASHHRFATTPPFDLSLYPNLGRESLNRALRSGVEGLGGHVVLGRNGAGKTILSLALAEAAAVVDAHMDEGSNRFLAREDDSYQYLRGGIVRVAATNPDETKGKQESPGRRRHTGERFLARVSFESHSDLVRSSTTVHRALIPGGGNRLGPAAQFLSVRLGLYPLLHRDVDTLSTGEVRRVLIARALARRPDLLVLDNAFDGLDVEGRRGLAEVVSRTLRGFSNDILVQGAGRAKNVARTQVVTFTHRPQDEIVDEMGRVTFLGGQKKRRFPVKTEGRGGRSGSELMRSLLAWEEKGEDDNDDCSDDRPPVGSADTDASTQEEMRSDDNADIGSGGDVPDLSPFALLRDVFPARKKIVDFWERGKSASVGGSSLRYGSALVRSHRVATSSAITTATFRESENVFVKAEQLEVSRGGVALLSDINWTVRRGERWHLAGTNGAGKSTLSRLLVQLGSADVNTDEFAKDRSGGDDAFVSDGSLAVAGAWMAGSHRASLRERGGLGWVSTELHLRAVQFKGDRSVLDWILRGSGGDDDAGVGVGGWGGQATANDPTGIVDVAVEAASWLGLLSNREDGGAYGNDAFLSRPFATLSQGEQKLVLVASAVARRPDLLVLDEPCQGLDPWNRALVLGMVERLCRATDVALVLVTHHNEELIPSISHVLCLDEGRVEYCGPAQYASRQR